MQLIAKLGGRAKLARSRILVAMVRLKGVEVGSGTRIFGRPTITMHPQSRITVGRNAAIVSISADTALGINHPVTIRTLSPGAKITIGDDVGVSGGTICAAIGVEIGNGVLLGANVSIFDTDFHPVVSASRRYERMPTPSNSDQVRIGENVFIGTGATILKGTWIGKNSVVGAGAVVRGVYEDNCIIAGNPAILVKRFVLPSEGDTS